MQKPDTTHVMNYLFIILPKMEWNIFVQVDAIDIQPRAVLWADANEQFCWLELLLASSAGRTREYVCKMCINKFKRWPDLGKSLFFAGMSDVVHFTDCFEIWIESMAGIEWFQFLIWVIILQFNLQPL